MILPFLYVIGCAGATVLLARRRFEEVLPLSLMGSAFVLYLSGLALGSLWPGYAVCVAFALALPVWLCVLLVRVLGEKKGGRLCDGVQQTAQATACAGKPQIARQTLRDALSRMFTPAFFVFCALGIVVFLLDWNKGFSMWDEYSHWGPMARETLRLDALYTSALARGFVHPDYPPLVCLFETLWCKLAGGYREAYLYRGLHVLSFSLFFPALGRLRWPHGAKLKKGVGFALTCTGILALLVTLPLCVELEDGGFYSTIYLDCLLGLLLAYGVFLVLDAKRWGAFELIRLGAALSFLLLTKQMGIAFFALILGVLAVDFVFTRGACLRGLFAAQKGLHGARRLGAVTRAIPKVLWWRGAGAVGTLVLLPLLLSKLWSWHVSALGLAQQFNLGGIDWAQVLASARGEGEYAWKQQVLSSYLEALGSYRIVVWGKLHVPYWALVLLFAAFLLLAAWAGKKLFARGQAVACTTLLLCGSAAYAFAMLLTYLTGFSQVESMRLASFPRYLGTYPFAMAALFGMVLLRTLCAASAQKDARQWQPALAACSVVALLWLFCMPAEQIKQLVPTSEYRSSSNVFNEIVREVEKRTPPDGSIFVLSQYEEFARDPGFYSIMLQYRLPDRTTAVSSVDLSLPQDQYAAQADALSKMLEGFDYLYLSNVDERCTDVYASLLGGMQAADKQIYKVEHSAGGAVALAPVA